MRDLDVNGMFEVLEKNLQKSLKPVNPSQVFIQRLHTRLINEPDIILENQPVSKRGMIIFTVLGFLLAGLIGWIVIFWVKKKD